MNTDKIYAEAIANEYSVKETSKVKALKRLDRKAKSTANIFGYTFGVVMALVLGVGMCLSMNVIGGGSQLIFIAGIIIGIVGIIGVSINYPIYKRLLENGKKKYAADIIMLAKEISEAEE
ncbi:MAG: dihydropteridine reductase [Lachnospiraceae bacterium]|nr:dihydropteridine reductase [Lachnospiraceae bacterium]